MSDKIKDFEKMKTNEIITAYDNMMLRNDFNFTVEQSKVFDCIMSNIFNIREDDSGLWIMINRNEIKEILRFEELKENDTGIYSKIFGMFDGIRDKTTITKTINAYSSSPLAIKGSVFNNEAIGTKNYYAIGVNKKYIKALQDRSGQYNLVPRRELAQLKSKYSIILYKFLRSLYGYKNAQSGNQYFIEFTLDELLDIFKQKKESYTSTSGFNWTIWEKRTLIPAIDEINSLVDGAVKILTNNDGKTYTKIKDGKIISKIRIDFELKKLAERSSPKIKPEQMNLEIADAISVNQLEHKKVKKSYIAKPLNNDNKKSENISFDFFNEEGEDDDGKE